MFSRERSRDRNRGFAGLLSSGPFVNFYITDPDSGQNITDPDDGQPIYDPDADLNYLELSQYSFYAPYMRKAYAEDVVYETPFSAASLAIPEFADRWGLDDFIVGTTTPNGYVLGSVVAPATGRTFSISGTTTGLTIDATTGQITLTDNATFSTAGTKSIVVTISDLGDIPMTIYVVAPNAGYAGNMFIDSVNGNDANSGRQPHLPKQNYNDAANNYPNTVYFKRGSTVTDANGPVSFFLQPFRTYRAYGDPSKPRPIVNAPAGGIAVIQNYFKANGVTPQTPCNDILIQDLDIYGNATTQRFFRLTGCTGVIKRCSLNNNIDDPNSAGIYGTAVSNLTMRHITTKNLYGDSFYFTSSANCEIGWVDVCGPNGVAADGIQFTGENNPSQRCKNIWIHDFIIRKLPGSTSGKGCIVVQETNNFLIENGFMFGSYFASGLSGQYGTCRNCYSYQTFYGGVSTWAYGYGANQTSWAHHYYDNICNQAVRALQISGFDTPPERWQRNDTLMNHNHGFGCYTPIYITEKWTGKIERNIFWDNDTAPNISGAAVVASNGGSISSMTYDSGTNLVTVNTTAAQHRLENETKVAVGGASDAGYNETVLINRTANNQFTYTPSSPPSSTPATGTLTWNQVYVYTTQTYANNVFQSARGPEYLKRPTITGTCQDGQDVTVNIPTIKGATAGAPEWRLNGLNIDGGTNPLFSIPAGYSANTNSNYMPTFLGLNAASLSCVVPYTDGAGNITYITAEWPSKKLYEYIAA